jgi:alkanesulfonate monooxygenase
MLEDVLQAIHLGWQGERGTGTAFQGRHARLEHVLNSPQALGRPHPPILIGGGGELRTLRLVARYADACNVFGTDPEKLRHKFEVLRRHCDSVGRDYESIERTILTLADVDPAGSASPDRLVERLGRTAEVGVHHAIFSVRDVHELGRLELIGSRVIPQLRDVGPPSPLP